MDDQDIDINKVLKELEDAYNVLIAGSSSAINNPSTDYNRFTDLAETDPEQYKATKERLIKSSRFYEAPKEEKPYEYDPDFDDPV